VSGDTSALTVGPDGNLWFPEGQKIGRITPSGVITEFSLNSSSPSPGSLTVGSDGNLWFPEGQKIGRITPSGEVTEFPLPLPALDLASPDPLTIGPDGNLWFPGIALGPAIAKITPAGEITDFPIPSGASGERALTVGSDGNLWFVEQVSVPEPGSSFSRIGRITPGGTITEFPNHIQTLLSLTLGPDGNLWFTENTATEQPKIGRITPSGEVTEFPLPLPALSLTLPNPLTAGPDGNLWFPLNDGIGRITPSGSFAAFPFPTAPQNFLGSLTAGPDGNLYFPEEFPAQYHTGSGPLGGRIDRISPAGDIITLPASSIVPGTVTVGPDGNLWYPGYSQALNGGPRVGIIGRVNLGEIVFDQPLTATSVTIAATPGSPFSGTVASFSDADQVTSTSSFTATINWGDNRTPFPVADQGVIASDGHGGFIITGTHTYDNPGTYTVTVTISDTDTSHDTGGAVALARSTANIVAAPPPTPPAITGVVTVAHSKKQITAIVIGFTETLDPISAGNPAFYSLALGVKKKHKLVFSRAVKIGGVSYDSNAHTVTLKLAKPARGTMQVTVHRGISATNGLLTGEDFTAVVK
jgi:virginiamycin B lyase